MVEHALRNTRFGPGKDDYGFIELIGTAFEKAYPLHDGFIKLFRNKVIYFYTQATVGP